MTINAKAVTIVRRHGYKAYLAIKIAKALAFPFVLVIWPAIAVLLLPAYMALGAFTWGKEVADVACNSLFKGQHWFSGFSRSYYNTLRVYKPKPVPLPPEDR